MNIKSDNQDFYRINLYWIFDKFRESYPGHSNLRPLCLLTLLKHTS